MPTTDTTPLAELSPDWAWAPYEPSADMPWNLQRAAHLLRRGGFAPTWRELDEARQAGPKEALRRLIDEPAEATSFYAQSERTVESLLATGNLQHLPAWWLYTMLNTPHPLREKITLFWHGHFATSAAKVTDPRLMYRQNALFRSRGLGPFGKLLSDASRDPAMLIWLDSVTNHKAHPNENFAREVMELFALGIGNYTEKDILEAARAFTGWELRGDQFHLNAIQHDTGRKTIFGRTGPWTGDDVLAMLLQQPAAAQLLVRKLYRFFVSETAELPASLVEPLAADLREHDYDISRLVARLLGSNLFYSRHAVGQRIKSPVEFAVGIVRSLEGATDTYALADDVQKLGQGVFYPPNVKGWDGGTTWINSATLLGRANLAWALVGGSDSRYKRKIQLRQLVERVQLSPADLVQRLVDVLIGRQVDQKVYVQLATLAGDATEGDVHLRWARVIQAITSLPEFQIV